MLWEHRLCRIAFGSALLIASTIGALGQSNPQGQCIASAAAGGSSDAITIPALPCALTTNLLILTASAENTTTTPTLQPLGLPAQVIVRPDGTALHVGDIAGAGFKALLNPTGSVWVLLNPNNNGGGGGSNLIVGGTSITGGVNGRILFDNSAVLGENTVTGSGSVVEANSPTLVTPNIGAATGLSIALTPASGTNPALSITQTISGSPASQFFSNPIVLNYGALSVPSSGGNFSIFGFGATCNYGSTSFLGAATCGYDVLNVTAYGAPGANNDFLVGHLTLCMTSANTTDSNAGIFCGNDNALVNATGWATLVGREINVTATQAISATKNGLRIAQAATDAFQGGVDDAAIEFINQSGAIGWKNVFLIKSGVISSGGKLLNAPNTTIDALGNLYSSSGFFGTSGGPALGTFVLDVRVGTNANFGCSNNGGVVQCGAFTDAIAITNLDLVGNTIAITALSGVTITGTLQISTGFFVNSSGNLQLGTAGTATGLLLFANGTSGTITVQAPATGALGSSVATLPINTGTLAETNFAQTFSAVQTFNANDLLLAGVTGLTQCLQASTLGVVTGTGAACGSGSGTVGSGAAGQLAFYSSSGTAVAGENFATLAQGGANQALTASAGGIVWSDASKLNILAGTATAGQCLLSGSSATPSWGSCGSGGGLTVGTTTIASGTAGCVLYDNSAVLGCDSGFTYTTAGQVSLALGTITANEKALNITATVNNSGVAFDAFLFMNITNTASSSVTFADFQIGGSSVFTVSYSNTIGFSATSAINGSVGEVVLPVIVDFGSAGSGTANVVLETAVQNVLVVNSGLGLCWSSTGVGSGNASTLRGNKDTCLTRAAAAHVQFGLADAAAPVAQTLGVQNVIAGTSNTAGQNWTLIGSLSTGTGTSGDMIFQTGGTGAGSTAQNSAVTAFTIKGATQNVIAAAHYLANGSAPTLGACGTSPSISGSDVAGKITVGSGTVTSCALTFHSTWGAAPACAISSASAITSPTVTTTTTTMTIGGSSLTSLVISYDCFSSAQLEQPKVNRYAKAFANDNMPRVAIRNRVGLAA